MPRRLIELGARPLLDLTSYARPGPGRRDRLSPTEIDHIARTARRAPEVMVKVLTRGGQDLKAVQRHLAYLDRNGGLPIETDDGERTQGRGVEKDLLEDWDLEVEVYRRRANLGARQNRSPPKLVHKVLFSMPPGTPPGKVLNAVRNFAREEFALKHRYAMVLHTDEPHPHVHVVIKAVSEQAVRLNIRKATLRDWRAKFAEQLRREGVAANATERAARGVSLARKSDGIYRANLRGESTHIRDRAYSVASELERGNLRVEEGKRQLRATRREVEAGWLAIGEILAREGYDGLAREVAEFVRRLPPARTEREWVAAELVQREREPPRHEPRVL